MGLRPWSEFWTVREWRKKDGLLPMVGILWLDSAESQGMVGQRKMSCAPWFMRTMSWKYVQGQSWTMVVVFDHFSNFEYSHSWQHGGCGSEHKPRKPFELLWLGGASGWCLYQSLLEISIEKILHHA